MYGTANCIQHRQHFRHSWWLYIVKPGKAVAAQLQVQRRGKKMSTSIIYFFTDFSNQGPYLGQMKSVLLEIKPSLRVVNLMSDAPFTDPRAGAYLLAALVRYLPDNAIVVAVVDPGVGSTRKALCMNVGKRWFLGPDNGLLSVVAKDAKNIALYEIDAPASSGVSASFHGRDLFAPAAGEIACGQLPKGTKMPGEQMIGATWGKNLSQIIYIDGFGNAMTGIRAASLPDFTGLEIGEQRIPRATTFSSVAIGERFCYENSIGLIEIAVNRGHAAMMLELQIGDSIRIPGMNLC
jgi:S-adenosylmethionine hydrolase